MRLRPFFFSLFLALALQLPVSAQHSDMGSWTTLSASKRFLEKFSADLDFEVRTRNNFSQLNLIYTNLGVSYKPVKFMKVSLVYRWIDKNRSEGLFGVRHRVYTDFAFRMKPGKFSLNYRARFQWEFRDQHSYGDAVGNQPESYWRNKFDIHYRINDRWSPYVGTELRFQFHNPRLIYGDFTWDRIRTYAGMDYAIDKKQNVGAYFLNQTEFNVKDPESLYIIGLEYSISFD